MTKLVGCRYYVAEGVRAYSQETWQLVMCGGGRACVARHLPAVVDYYVAQSKANNHAVRETACTCMAEVLEKVRGGGAASPVWLKF